MDMLVQMSLKSEMDSELQTDTHREHGDPLSVRSFSFHETK